MFQRNTLPPSHGKSAKKISTDRLQGILELYLHFPKRLHSLVLS
jgi:hypothetical protein